MVERIILLELTLISAATNAVFFFTFSPKEKIRNISNSFNIFSTRLTVSFFEEYLKNNCDDSLKEINENRYFLNVSFSSSSFFVYHESF